MQELDQSVKHLKKHGHEVFSIDWNTNFNDIDLYADISNLSYHEIIDIFGHPDVIWASPDCTTYSVAAISHHRVKTSNTLKPVSDYAKQCDRTNIHVLNLIAALKPKYYFIENPRGGLRKMGFMQDIPRYTVTYCQYGDTRMKPTDIWTNHPNPKFKPACKNGDKCHIAAPRGSNTGTEGLKNSVDKSRIPDELCEHIVKICEE